jgi:hypothetical protein
MILLRAVHSRPVAAPGSYLTPAMCGHSPTSSPPVLRRLEIDQRAVDDDVGIGIGIGIGTGTGTGTGTADRPAETEDREWAQNLAMLAVEVNAAITVRQQW